MGRGTPCPMPPGKRVAIQTQIMAMKALGSDIYEIAEKMQGEWPGCNSNHVRGVIAGLEGAALGGKKRIYQERVRRMAEPWKPGTPRNA